MLQNQPFTRQEVEAQLEISTHPKITGCQGFDGLPGAGVCSSVMLCSCSSRKAVPVCCWEGPRLGVETAASISGNSHARNQGFLLLGEGTHNGYFALFEVKPAAVAPGWKPRAVLGWMGCGMWGATLLLPDSTSTWHSRLSSLFQGPAERRWQHWAPSDGRMVVLRQFGLLLWKNYILQVGWHCAQWGHR